MNSRLRLLAPFSFCWVALLPAQTAGGPPGVPAGQVSPDTTLYTPPAGEDQRVYGERQSSLITAEATRAVVEKFRATYGSTAAPRLVIYVNRSLGSMAPAEAPPALADRQTVREVERIFGRIFRLAGAKLADTSAAAALLAGQPDVQLQGANATKERAALSKVADIAIEVLISSHNLTITRISGDYTYEVPDLQVTAIRLGDAAIIGQTAANEVIGRGERAVRIARQFAMTDITEATAYALMQDMLTEAK